MLVDNILEWKKSVHLEGRAEGRAEGEEVGLRKGEQVGLQKGEQVGLRKGELALLLRQLTSKFGPLPAEVVDRLERANVDQLLGWGVRVLKAKNLDEVFAG